MGLVITDGETKKPELESSLCVALVETMTDGPLFSFLIRNLNNDLEYIKTTIQSSLDDFYEGLDNPWGERFHTEFKSYFEDSIDDSKLQSVKFQLNFQPSFSGDFGYSFTIKEKYGRETFGQFMLTSSHLIGSTPIC